MREGGGGIVESAQQSIDVVACNYCFVPREFLFRFVDYPLELS